MRLLKSFGIACLIFAGVVAYVSVFTAICMWLQSHAGLWASLTFVAILMINAFTWMAYVFSKGRG